MKFLTQYAVGLDNEPGLGGLGGGFSGILLKWSLGGRGGVAGSGLQERLYFIEVKYSCSFPNQPGKHASIRMVGGGFIIPIAGLVQNLAHAYVLDNSQWQFKRRWNSVLSTAV